MPEAQAKRLTKAFATGQGAGLFLLATERWEGGPGASFRYWRDFAARYLTALCHIPETVAELTPLAPPEAAELAALLSSAPPMPGAEYLDEASLVGVWNDLDAWVRGEVAAGGEGFLGFSSAEALWHQVGRVCFHLAENRRDEDHPFAFLATYGPALPAVRRAVSAAQPGARNGGARQAALVRLLSPCSWPGKARWSRTGRSGDLYQPLAWTPREIYQFLGTFRFLRSAGSWADARLVEETPPAPRRRDDWRHETKEVRHRGCSISMSIWRRRREAYRRRMAG